MQTTNRLSVPQKQLSIKVLGVGGAGSHAVTHLARGLLAGVSFAVIDTDSATLEDCEIEQRILLGGQTTRGLGAGSDPERGRAAAQEQSATLRDLCDGVDVILVVAGLGGGTGTGAAPVLARIARDCKALVFAIVLMPFDFEGARRGELAAAGLREFKSAADGVVCLPNQKLLKLVERDTAFADGLARMNEFVARAVRSIWTLIARPGIVQAGFSNLCAATQGRHVEGCLAIGEGSGPHRAREAAERLLAHPLLDDGAALAEATTALISIVAGPGLSIAEVHEVMERISRSAARAHLTMGAVVDASLDDALQITLIAGRAEPESEKHDRAAAVAPAVAAEDPTPVPPATDDKSAKGSADKQQPPVRGRKAGQRMRQGQLALEIFSRGRFEKSEPTIYHGQDLDVPTYIRRGVALN